VHGALISSREVLCFSPEAGITGEQGLLLFPRHVRLSGLDGVISEAFCFLGISIPRPTKCHAAVASR
jgi:hypothetical protein